MKPEDKGVAEQDWTINGWTLRAYLDYQFPAMRGHRPLTDWLDKFESFIASPSVSLGTTTQIPEITEPDVITVPLAQTEDPSSGSRSFTGYVNFETEALWRERITFLSNVGLLTGALKGLIFQVPQDVRPKIQQIILDVEKAITPITEGFITEARKAPSVSTAPESDSGSVIPKSVVSVSTAEIAEEWSARDDAQGYACDIFVGATFIGTAQTASDALSIIRNANALARATEKLEAEIKRLTKYTQHTRGCRVAFDYCDCGLVDLELKEPHKASDPRPTEIAEPGDVLP